MQYSLADMLPFILHVLATPYVIIRAGVEALVVLIESEQHFPHSMYYIRNDGTVEEQYIRNVARDKER